MGRVSSSVLADSALGGCVAVGNHFGHPLGGALYIKK